MVPHWARRPGLKLTRLDFSDRACLALLVALAGHGLAGKGFAYLGVAPLLVTEVVLAGLIVAMLQTGCILASMANVSSIILLALMALVLLRTLPYIPEYGFDALRDSVIVLYGLFAFAVTTLLLARPERLLSAVRFLRWFTAAAVFAGPLMYLTKVANIPMPSLPGTNVPLIPLRAGELGVHLSGCAVMALVGLRSTRWPWLCALIFGVLLVASQNRGGMLAIAIPFLFALPFTGAWKRVLAMAVAGAILLSAGYAADLELSLLPREERPAGDRPLGIRQVVDNVLSVVIPTENKQLDDTKTFRIMWWTRIVEYTLHGPYFWTGKGFGINLAVDDGFTGTPDDPSAPPLRSPHNSHLTVLARAGVPGVVLWGLLLLSWFGSVMLCAVRAWLRGHDQWGDLLLFLACYWLANIINASFDVALEAPMLGVWFWCLTGMGIAAQAIYRASLTEHDMLRTGDAVSHARLRRMRTRPDYLGASGLDEGRAH